MSQHILKKCLPFDQETFDSYFCIFHTLVKKPVSKWNSGETLKPKAMHSCWMEISYSVTPEIHFETGFKLIIECHRVVMKFNAPCVTFVFCFLSVVIKRSDQWRHTLITRSINQPFNQWRNQTPKSSDWSRYLCTNLITYWKWQGDPEKKCQLL